MCVCLCMNVHSCGLCLITAMDAVWPSKGPEGMGGPSTVLGIHRHLCSHSIRARNLTERLPVEEKWLDWVSGFDPVKLALRGCEVYERDSGQGLGLKLAVHVLQCCAEVHVLYFPYVFYDLTSLLFLLLLSV